MERTTDDETFDCIMRSLDAPVAVVTTASQGENAGCLIGFQTQCSIDPRHLAIWLSKANYTYRVGLHADHFAVHWLSEDDRSLAELFGSLSGDDVDKFARCGWTPGHGDVPILQGCPNYIVGRRIALLAESSDHVCLVLDPVVVSGVSFRPLRLSMLSDITAGHTVDERPTPPTLRAHPTPD